MKRYHLLWAPLCIVGLLLVFSINMQGQAQSAHPRLFFTSNQLPALRQQTTTTHADIWDGIEAYATEQLGTSPPSSAPSNGDLEYYRNAGNGLVPLAFACVISERDDFCDLAISHLLTYVNWNQWDEGGIRDLGHAHMLMGTSLAYDWLYNDMSQSQRNTVRNRLSLWTQRMYEASVAENYVDGWNNWWRQSYIQNHFAINNAGLGLAALALEGETASLSCEVSANATVNRRTEPSTNADIAGSLTAGEQLTVVDSDVDSAGFTWWQLEDGSWVREDVVSEIGNCAGTNATANDWLNHAVTQFTIFQDMLNQMGDGTWHEGIPYQNYWMSLVYPFWDNLRRLRNVDVIPYDYLEQFAVWRLYNYLPNDEFIITTGNFDWIWANGYEPQSLLRFAAREFQDPHTQWLASSMLEGREREPSVYTTPWQVFEFFYYDADLEEEEPADLPPMQVFSDAESVIWRNGWGQNAMIFGFDTGAYGGRTQYEEFVQNIPPWNCSVTSCEFNIGHNHRDANSIYLFNGRSWLLPEAIGEDRNATSQHNTILIDGENQYIPPTNRYSSANAFVNSDGELQDAVATSNFGYISGEATNRYSRSQEIDYVGRQIAIIDNRYFVVLDALRDNQTHLYEWVMHFENSVSANQGWIRGQADFNQAVDIARLLPAGTNATTGDDGSPFVHIRANGANAQFLNVIFPVSNGYSRSQFRLLKNNGRSLALRVTSSSGDWDDVLLNETGEHATLEPYTFDGNVAAIQRTSDGDLKRIFVYGGTFLSSDDVPQGILVDDLNSQSAFEAEYDGTTIFVEGTFTSPVRLYAPGVRQLFLNGEEEEFVRTGNYILFGAAFNLGLPPFSNDVAHGEGPDQDSALTLSSEAEPGFAAIGDSIRWTVQLANYDVSQIDDVWLENELPPELRIVGASSSLGQLDINGHQLRVTHDALSPEEFIILQIDTEIPEDTTTPFSLRTTSTAGARNLRPVRQILTVNSVVALPNTGESLASNVLTRIAYVAGVGILLMSIIIFVSVWSIKRFFR